MNLKLYAKNTLRLFSRLKLLLNKNEIPWSAEISKSIHLRDSKVGKHTFIGPNCIINSTDIGSYTCIAPGVQIGGMEHSHWWLSTNPQLSDQCIFGNRTVIGNDVWIAANAIIKQGVTIGDGAVVGAGAFVNKDVPPYAIVVGVPAKVIKMRLDSRSIQMLLESRYWLKSPQEAKSILNDISVSTNY